MAKREIVTITCDGPCEGRNTIPADYDATWVIGRSDRKYRYVDLCPSCASGYLDQLYDKGAHRMAERPVTPEVRADRKEAHLLAVEERWPTPDQPAIGLTVTPDGLTNVGVSGALDEAFEVPYDDNDEEPAPLDDEPLPEELPEPQAVTPAPTPVTAAPVTTTNPPATIAYTTNPTTAPNWFGATSNG